MTGWVLVGLLASGPAAASVPAEVLAVVDGDTVRVSAAPWPHLRAEALVRLAGIDAPELAGRCDAERRQAEQARERLAELLPAGARVTLRDVQPDKYSGRVVADIALPAPSTTTASAVRIREGLVRRYDGGARLGWCEAP